MGPACSGEDSDMTDGKRWLDGRRSGEARSNVKSSKISGKVMSSDGTIDSAVYWSSQLRLELAIKS